MAKHPVVTDPDTHRIIFENDQVRVVEAKIPDGGRVPLHSHPARLVLAMSDYRLRVTVPGEVATVVERKKGQISWVEAESHEAESVDGPIWAVEVEVKG